MRTAADPVRPLKTLPEYAEIRQRYKRTEAFAGGFHSAGMTHALHGRTRRNQITVWIVKTHYFV
jgi:hypothetical protein